MFLRARDRLQQLPRRWQIALGLSVSALLSFALWDRGDVRLRSHEYGCQPPPFSFWRMFQSADELQHENHHTFMSSPGSGILMLQHCVHPSRRVLMPLTTHLDYTKRHGYAYSVRTGLSDPKRNKKNSPYWEKVYLTQQVIEEQWELPEADRVEWIVWADADTLILNPTIAMENFLPPKHDVNSWFVISRGVLFRHDRKRFELNFLADHWGVNFGVFAIRPTKQAWDFLWEMLWVGDALPKWVLPMKEQSAMQMLLPRPGVVIIPKDWANGWGQADPFEVLEKAPFTGGSPTSLQAHFTGRNKAGMEDYIQYFADPRFNQSWEAGKRHWEEEAARFWDSNSTPLCISAAP